MFYWFIFLNFVYAFYAQLSIGNVWYRHSANGGKTIQLASLLGLIINPLYSKTLWNIKLWDVNYFIFMGTGMLLGRFIRNIFQR
jgi:hypothetical protein